MTRTVTLFGHTFSVVVDLETDGARIKDPSVAAAKTGQLTIRTSTTVGTLTMANGHGITTGAKFNLFWDDGSRLQVTAGTVTVNSVPFTVGTGDDLPDNLTTITAHLESEEGFAVTGNNCSMIGGILKAGAVAPRGYIRFLDGSDAELFVVKLTSDEMSYFWIDDDSFNNPVFAANPIAGDVVAKVRFSHNDTTARQMVAVAMDS
jgi:hypothetical protein